jgi:HEAT repeat protein
MKQGMASERLVRDVLKNKKGQIDASCIEPFLNHAGPMVRRMAARVVGAKGDACVLIEAILREKDDEVLPDMLGALVAGEGIEALAELLNRGNPFVKEAVVRMFRRTKRSDCLFPLLFDKDDSVVNRIKRYLHEKN